MKRLSAGLAILIAVFMSSTGTSYAAVDGGAAPGGTSVPSRADCNPDIRVCGQWNYAGRPSYVFTGGIGKSDRVFRLGAERDIAYISVDTRWNLPMAGNVGRYGETGNFLLACGAVSKTCELVKASASSEIMHVVSVDGPTLLTEIETYRTDDLNRHDVSYVRSIDHGRTWSAVPVPENCNSRRSCRMVGIPGGDYVLLATDTSAESFDKWTTNVYRSTDGGQTWTRYTQEHGVLSTEWSAYASRDGVYMPLGPRDHQTAIVNIVAGREDVVLSDISSLHGHVIKMIGGGALPYALVDSGIFPARESRLFVIENNTAKELWRGATLVGNVWINDETIVLHTNDTSEMVLPVGVFRSVLQISTDRGKTWRIVTLPDELADSIIDVVDKRIWVVTPGAVWYQDIG